MHRVHVRQDQDAGARVAGGAVGGVQQRARGGAQRRQFHRQAGGRRVVGDDARHRGDAFRKVRRRFALQPALDAGDDLFSALSVGHGGIGIQRWRGRGRSGDLLAGQAGQLGGIRHLAVEPQAGAYGRPGAAV
ncbi:hypothetical protein G6F65_020689 [Rhizopus arrhizus]|nr:hypothetical protein G6F65_020689 [Rhizopus arrhizus]